MIEKLWIWVSLIMGKILDIMFMLRFMVNLTFIIVIKYFFCISDIYTNSCNRESMSSCNILNFNETKGFSS